MTVEEFINEIIRVFRKAGIACAEAEAAQLACHVLSCSKSWLYSHKGDEVEDKVLLASAALINERCKGRPLQYIIGTANFYGIDLAVDERVLIPRPETEVLVETALKELSSFRPDAACSEGIAAARQALGVLPEPLVLDLCTGSGAIAAAVAANLPKARVIATDLSPKAFMLARANLRPYKNVQVLRGDLFDALSGLKDSSSQSEHLLFDAILTNPPYIPADAIAGLAKEVRDFEPHMALDGGQDGLDIVKRIIEQAPKHLKSGGLLLMEIGDDQGADAVQIAASQGAYKEAVILKDLAGKDRILKAVTH